MEMSSGVINLFRSFHLVSPFLSLTTEQTGVVHTDADTLLFIVEIGFNLLETRKNP